MNNIRMTVEEEAPILLEYVEAKIKPEQIKDVTPGWEPKTVTPDDGCVLSRVNVAGMPEPTEVMEIGTNGDHHVERAGIARVQVPIPPGYIIPSGKILFTENGTDIDVRELESVDIAVPVPEMPEEYATGGSLTNKTLTGYHFPADSTATSLLTEMFRNCSELETVENFPTSIVSLPNYCFQNCVKLKMSVPDSFNGTFNVGCYDGCSRLNWDHLPVNTKAINNYVFRNTAITIKTIPQGVTVLNIGSFINCTGISELTMLGNITTISNDVFNGCSNCLLYDFRNCTAVPKLNHTNAFNGINANAKIVVPDSLIQTWKAATNWPTYADKIIGVSDYDAS